MAATVTVTARIPREIKHQAEKALHSQGLTTSEAINRLLESVALSGCFPKSILPDTHRFPEPGLREFNDGVKAQSQNELKEESTTLFRHDETESMLRLMKFKIQDWGEDLDRPYKEIIEDERHQQYEALS